MLLNEIILVQNRYFLNITWTAYKGRLDDRQMEIDRIAQENRGYREYFIKLVSYVLFNSNSCVDIVFTYTDYVK